MGDDVKKKILVVEDDASIRRMLELSLQRTYDVRVVEDGLAGLEMAKEWQPDLFLLDVMLPGITGLQLARELRKVPGLERVPLAFLTAKDDPKSMAEGIISGARHYIVKPFSLHEVMKLVERMLR